jgi:tRNA dimethylallyltransferase
VGGTSYWIQNLIFPGRLVSESKSLSSSPKHSWTTDVLQQQSDDISRSISLLEKGTLELFINLPEHPPSASKEPEAAWKLYALLSNLDPITSSRWHWRDTRKILRSLQIIKETGRKASDVMAEQTMDPSQGQPRSAVSCTLLFICSRLIMLDSALCFSGYIPSLLTLMSVLTAASIR